MHKSRSSNIKSSTKGFTLIELLVVISIIAIISVVAVTSYININADARDAKRRAELEALANTLEVNKTTGGGSYNPVLADMFSTRVFPGGVTSEAYDPQGYPYCISTNTSTTIPAFLPQDLAGVAGWTNIPGSRSCPTSPSGWIKLTGGEPVTGTFAWTICTRMENKGTPQALCRSNTQ